MLGEGGRQTENSTITICGWLTKCYENKQIGNQFDQSMKEDGEKENYIWTLGLLEIF